MTEEYWEFIISAKHPSMQGKEAIVQRALKDADQVRQSARDPTVFLYYLSYNEYWICVVCNHENGSGFIITTYITDRIKEGINTGKRN